jgi:membrane protease YdiL (CAAX protease family)
MAFNQIKRGTLEMKLFLFLWGATIVGHILIIPYLYSLQFEKLSAAGISPLAFDIMSILQGAILGALFAFLGVNISVKAGIGFSIILKHLSGNNQKEAGVALFNKAILFSVVLTMSIVALMIVAGQTTTFDLSRFNMSTVFAMAAGAYDGLLEEIIFRLILFSAIFWGFKRLGDERAGWLAFVVTVFLATAGQIFLVQSIQLEGGSSGLAVLIGLFFSLVYNYLYWKKGFETSVLVHIFTNVLLQAVIPLFFTGGVPL